jgi:hypothetical protein
VINHSAIPTPTSIRAIGFFKAAAFVGLVALLATMSLPVSRALAQHVGQAGAQPPVPTTRILAIGRLTPNATPTSAGWILPQEIRATTRLYLEGKIDQWYIRPDETAVVFILNLSDVKEAHDLLDKLPLGQAGLMKFEYIPLGPLSPLRLLISEPAKK